MTEFRPLLLMIATLWLSASSAHALDINPCRYDRSEMLNLDFQSFDQDLSNGGGGWRKLLKHPGCERVAANLIRDYRRKNGSTQDILIWHEGQLRAMAGQYPQALRLFEMSRRTEDETGWNAYVDATIAFLEKDKQGLTAARDRLATLEHSPEFPPLKNGYFELPNGSGKPTLVRWPPNIDVVDGLIKCFGKPYSVAYMPDCRPPIPDRP